MLDVTAWDAAARRATWETPQGELALPAVAHPHSATYPVPGFARMAIAEAPVDGLPTLVTQGTVFTSGPDEPGPLSVPRSLVYPSSAPRGLQQAADELNQADGAVRVCHDVEQLEPHEGLVVLPRARGIADDPWELAAFLVTARERAGPNAVVFTPGLGRPWELALAAYAGVDILDGIPAVLAGLQGQYWTPEGALASQPDEFPCACAACAEAAGPLERDALVEHNRWVTEAEARRVRHAIKTGGLRELIEGRVRAAPALVATLRRFDLRHAGFFEQRTPILRQRTLPVVGETSLTRPEVQRWVDRLAERYRAPESARIMVVLPCSATKPYEDSPTHRRIRPAVTRNGKGRVHIVTLTSPIGGVPEELELAYPACHYDVPVTGDWSATEEELIQRAFTALWKNSAYDHAILHVPPEEAELVERVLPSTQRTVEPGQRPTDGKTLAQLSDAVTEAARGLEAMARKQVFAEQMVRRVDWQFGPNVAGVLLDGVEIKGKYPWLKLMDGHEQIAMLHPERGNLVLTGEGGRRLFEATDRYTVEIDDFHPKGTIFAPGVIDASPDIRIEDAVVVHHDGAYRGTGRAVAPGVLMGAMTSGGCVEMRHHTGGDQDA